MRTFKVVGRARSSAIFEGEEKVVFRVDFGGHLLHFLVGTHLEKPHGEGVPGGIFVEISGEAEQLIGAAELFTNHADVLLGILAIGSNAFIDHLECELAFEVTEGSSEREFLQVLIPRAPAPAFPARTIKRALAEDFAKSSSATAISACGEPLRIIGKCSITGTWKNGFDALPMHS